MTDFLKPYAPAQWNDVVDWGWLPHLAEQVLRWGLDIQAIPSPTFYEAKRASRVQELFESLQLDSVTTDERYNVYGRLPARQPIGESGVMVCAHLDTVFPFETSLRVREQGDLIYAPGLGDNSLGVAAMLGLIEGLRTLDIACKRDLWFVATTREEGLGDLGGMRLAYETLKDKVSTVINLEGMAFGHVYHEGIAVRRFHIRALTEGGHSWAHFGRPSAIHSLMRLGANIAQLTTPEKPRTTFNIGMIDGGQSINTIASEASLWLDLRSEATGQLNALEERVRHLIALIENSDIRFEVEIVGNRPAGSIPAEHPLVQVAMNALELVSVKGALATGSTDGNISLAADCATVTLGITRGGNAHRLDEYIERTPIHDGMKHLFLVILTLVAQLR